MKKFVTTISIILIIIIASSKIIYGQGVINKLKNTVTGMANTQSSNNQVKNNDEMLESISSKIIRFHVIANSDSDKDQNLKIKVKDAVIKYLFPKLNDSKDISQSREILKANDENIKNIALKVIHDNGYDYSVKSTLSHENFPVKTYGDITLPEGNYEAYRIIIGSGQGKNWWCVMFPPLCFIDITRGSISEDETKSSMERVLTKDEYKYIDNSKTAKSKSTKKNSSGKPKIQFRFKIIDLINKLV